MAVYGDVCQALDDDHENVRQAALRIICVLSHTYPERCATFWNVS